MTHAPRAHKILSERHFHGDVYTDNYEWFRDKENPELLAHLEAENAWTRERTVHLEPLREQLVSEIAALTKQSDTTVPWREGRLFSLNSAELQILGASLLLGLAAAWGALHVFALADRAGRPKSYATIRIVLIVAWFAAALGGMSWTLGRVA